MKATVGRTKTNGHTARAEPSPGHSFIVSNIAHSRTAQLSSESSFNQWLSIKFYGISHLLKFRELHGSKFRLKLLEDRRSANVASPRCSNKSDTQIST
eukprot:scaffold23502_cov161-Skeletonema_dohrnii-CCMP3373.AAC.1